MWILINSDGSVNGLDNEELAPAANAGIEIAHGKPSMLEDWNGEAFHKSFNFPPKKHERWDDEQMILHA